MLHPPLARSVTREPVALHGTVMLLLPLVPTTTPCDRGWVVSSRWHVAPGFRCQSRVLNPKHPMTAAGGRAETVGSAPQHTHRGTGCVVQATVGSTIANQDVDLGLHALGGRVNMAGQVCRAGGMWGGGAGSGLQPQRWLPSGPAVPA